MTATTTAPAVTRAVSGNFPGADATVTDPETDQSFFAHLTTHADDDGSDWQLVITSLSQAEWCSDEQEALERAHAAAATALGYGEFNSDRLQRGMILTGSAPFDGYVSTWLATPPTVGSKRLGGHLRQLGGIDHQPTLPGAPGDYPWLSDRIPAPVLDAIAKEALHCLPTEERDWTEFQVRNMASWAGVAGTTEAALRGIYGQSQGNIEAFIADYGIARALKLTRYPTRTGEQIDLDDVFAAVTGRLALECALAVADHAADALFADDD